MSSTPFMPLWVPDFTSKTSDLDAKETGAYLLILMALWTRGGTLPAEQKKLQRIARVGREWPKVWDTISHYFTIEDGQLSQKRLTEELQKVNAKREVNAQAGARGGRAKALKNKQQALANATVSLKQPEPEPEISSVELARTPADDFRAKCFEAAGLDPQEAMAVPGLVSTVSLEHLIRDRNNPCDPEMDVLPAIQTCAATLRKRGQTLTNWSYCREAAIRNRDQRLAGNPAPVAQPAQGNASRKPAGKRADSSFAAAGMRVAAQIHSRGRSVDTYERDAGSDAADQLAAMWAGHRGPDGPGAGGKPGAMALNHERADGEEGSGGVGVGTGGDSLRPEAA